MTKTKTSREAQRLFETMKANIQERLKTLGVSPYRASHYSGHNGTWISDCFRRSSGVTLSWLADVSEVLNIPAHELIKPTKAFKAELKAGFYEPPRWMKNLPSI